MTVKDNLKQRSDQAREAAPEKKDEITEAVRYAEVAADEVELSQPKHTVASYSKYGDAEKAVDWLSDQGFAVERSAIVGSGLRSVEQVAGRMTRGRAALLGAGQGALVGSLFALLFGIFFSGPDFAGLLLYALVLGASFGALFGASRQYANGGGRRDFVSATAIEADRYDLQVDGALADEAKRLLDAMPARSDLAVASALELAPHGYQRRRQVTEEIADADGGERLMRHERAVDSREGEPCEMVGRVARRVEAEDDLHLHPKSLECESSRTRVTTGCDGALAGVDGLRGHHHEDAEEGGVSGEGRRHQVDQRAQVLGAASRAGDQVSAAPRRSARRPAPSPPEARPPSSRRSGRSNWPARPPPPPGSRPSQRRTPARP